MMDLLLGDAKARDLQGGLFYFPIWLRFLTFGMFFCIVIVQNNYKFGCCSTLYQVLKFDSILVKKKKVPKI